MVIQDGARLHYAIPRALQRANLLDRVFTSWYSQPGTLSYWLARMMCVTNKSLGRKMLDRYAPGLDFARVVQFRSQTWQERRARKRFLSDRAFHGWASEQFAARVRNHGGGGGWRDADAIFGFIRNIHPDLCRAAHNAGLVTIADQMIAPYEIELAEEKLQRERFPHWSDVSLPGNGESWTAFEQSTWDQLDHITCASAYVRDGLVQRGIAPARISVLPYPIDVAEFPSSDRSGRESPMLVGFVGAVGLRKGAPYFIDVARRMNTRAIRFVMIGPTHLSPAVLSDARQHVEIIGPVPRSEVRSWLGRFDVYFFPSTCEGSAGSVMEAMASGLPIVTSPNAGSIVEHGKSGYIWPYSQVDSYVQSLAKLAADPTLRVEMGRIARKAAEACSLENYGIQWKAMLSRLAAAPAKKPKSFMTQQ
jgi:glycosyltransferase involved in cell wall biosynthesis